jgi:hypothetical protein
MKLVPYEFEFRPEVKAAVPDVIELPYTRPAPGQGEPKIIGVHVVDIDADFSDEAAEAGLRAVRRKLVAEHGPGSYHGTAENAAVGPVAFACDEQAARELGWGSTPTITPTGTPDRVALDAHANKQAQKPVLAIDGSKELLTKPTEHEQSCRTCNLPIKRDGNDRFALGHGFLSTGDTLRIRCEPDQEPIFDGCIECLTRPAVHWQSMRDRVYELEGGKRELEDRVQALESRVTKAVGTLYLNWITVGGVIIAWEIVRGLFALATHR